MGQSREALKATAPTLGVLPKNSQLQPSLSFNNQESPAKPFFYCLLFISEKGQNLQLHLKIQLQQHQHNLKSIQYLAATVTNANETWALTPRIYNAFCGNLKFSFCLYVFSNCSQLPQHTVCSLHLPFIDNCTYWNTSKSIIKTAQTRN